MSLPDILDHERAAERLESDPSTIAASCLLIDLAKPWIKSRAGHEILPCSSYLDLMPYSWPHPIDGAVRVCHGSKIAIRFLLNRVNNCWSAFVVQPEPSDTSPWQLLDEFEHLANTKPSWAEDILHRCVK